MKKNKTELVYLCFGGNLGDTEKNIVEAIQALEDFGLKKEKQSSFWLTEPQGYVEQDWFTNCVCGFSIGNIKPLELLDKIHEIEYLGGRKRDLENKNAPRTLDIDILDFTGLVLDTPTLTLPHPRMGTRAFVLVPLKEIEPEYKMPQGTSLQELLEDLEYTVANNKIHQH